MNPVSCIYDKSANKYDFTHSFNSTRHSTPRANELNSEVTVKLSNLSCSRQGCKYPLTKCNAIENMDLFTKLLRLNGNIIYHL